MPRRLEDPQPQETALAWWPAQRPDKVYLDVASAEAGTGQRAWARGIDRDLPEGGRELVKHWAELGIVAETPGSDGQPVYVETERLLKSPED